ncbi:membrane dipeptidase [Hydrobacter penzbergensis]|uniref:Membrane dipeptidase n=1 Tax=Hydrobacter penzbergensis TaxID=1235997 RepID=A0A8X8IG62_9BACT|nr:dipeptidase [Hydrobacter penzbergensis]SDX10008.1 membrane dipeptidase [Hydrobacter penzbergensis]
MKYFSPWLFALLLPAGMQAQAYQKLHAKATVVDTHNDVLTQSLEKNVVFDEDMKTFAHSDLRRMQQGGIDVQVFSVWCDGSYGKGRAFARANREIDTLYEWVKRNPASMMIVKTPHDLQQAVKTKKLACMMGVEGGHMIENNLQYLDSLYKRGVRYMTLTWNNSTPWATSAMDESSGKVTNAKKGLNDFGIQVVKRMNQLGMMVDLSHVGEQTFWDAIHTTTKPVIVSHSCAYTLCPVFRNLKDDQIDAVGKNGGVIHLNFFSGFLDSSFQRKLDLFNARHKEERDTILKMNPEPFFADSYLAEKYADEVKELRPPLSLLIDHIDYIVKRIGIDHVGLGSDFDGITSAPIGLDDVSCYPLVTKALKERGYSNGAIRKILGENFLRVFAANSR